MAKISQLPLVAEPDGTEDVVVVKGGATRRGVLGALVGAAANPHVMAAEIARDQAADLVLPQNIFIDIPLVVAEGSVSEATFFKIVDSSTGLVDVYRRTATGSTHLYDETTAAALRSALGSGLVGHSRTEPGAIVRDLREILHETEVSTKDFGAIGDGETNDTDACEKALATGKNIFFPIGDYKISAPLQLAIGQHVRGHTPGEYALAGTFSRIFNDEVGGGCLWYTGDTYAAERKGPRIRDLSLRADFPIKLNDENTAVITDGSNVPFPTRPGVINCDISARAMGAGIGIAMTKAFHWEITDCLIRFFDIGVLLNGCDLGRLEHSRIEYAHAYHILELAASTFCSQNDIRHNDVLHAAHPDCIFIKSDAIHVRIYNNYLEHSTTHALSAASVRGFIDISAVNKPSFAGNEVAFRSSAIADDNRIDGHHHATDFIYRFEPTGRTYGRIRDVGTSGPAATAPTLLLCDNAGISIDEVPFRYNTQNLSQFEFVGSKFGKWNGYRSDSEYSHRVDGTNLTMFGYGTLGQNNAANYLRARGSQIVLKSGLASNWQMRFPAALGMFGASRTYIATLRAKVAGGGAETISFARLLNGTGDTLQAFALNEQFADYSLEFTSGSTPATDENGLYFTRTNNGAEIIIDSLGIQPKYEKEYPRTTYASPVAFVLNDDFGIVEVIASADGFVNLAYRRYAVVRQKLVEIVSEETNPSILTVTAATYESSTRTVTVTLGGSAGTKFLTLGQNPA